MKKIRGNTNRTSVIRREKRLVHRGVFLVVSLVLVSGDQKETGHFFLKNTRYPATVEKDPGRDR